MIITISFHKKEYKKKKNSEPQFRLDSYFIDLFFISYYKFNDKLVKPYKLERLSPKF